MHEHEEAGEAALIVAVIAGVAALGAMVLKDKFPRVARYAFVITLLALLLSSAAFFRTAHLGGLIHHEEIRK